MDVLPCKGYNFGTCQRGHYYEVTLYRMSHLFHSHYKSPNDLAVSAPSPTVHSGPSSLTVCVGLTAEYVSTLSWKWPTWSTKGRQENSGGSGLQSPCQRDSSAAGAPTPAAQHSQQRPPLLPHSRELSGEGLALQPWNSHSSHPKSAPQISQCG